MEKPELHERRPALDYNECVKYINFVLNRDINDYYGHFKPGKNLYEKYEKDIEPAPVQFDENKEVTREYSAFFERQMEWVAKQEAIPYCDFWHWLCDEHEIYNGCTFYMWFDDLEKKEDWIKEILEAFRRNFSEYVEDDMLFFEVNW